MKIVVLAKQVPDTWSDRKLDLVTGMLDRAASEPVPDEINERSCEVALQYKDAAPDTEVVVLTVGPEDATKTVRKLLSMGADAAVLISDEALAGSDAVQTARVIAAGLERIGADLVIAGNESTDGRGGLLPAMVAELQGLAVVPPVERLHISEAEVSGTVHVDDGTVDVAASLPAVATVTEKAAEPRFPNFKNIMAAKKKPLQTWSVADLGIEAGPQAATVRSVMVSAEPKPEKQAGPKVTDDGTGAEQLVAFLAERRLA